jgi:hypothetical protein
MVVSKLYRKKTNGNYHDGDTVRWLDLVDQAELHNEKKDTIKEFENIIDNGGWEEDINTAVIKDEDKIKITTDRR